MNPLLPPGPIPTHVGRSRRLLRWSALLILAAPLVFWLIATDRSADGSPGLVGTRGGPAPDFTFTFFDGTDFRLSRHLSDDGRPVVLNFWASWCVPCREEMPALDAVARRRPEVLFVGVAVRDTEDEARSFAAEIGVVYPLGIDGDGEILERYPILGLPTTWFITADGLIAATWAGQLDDQKLEEMIDRHLTSAS